MEAINKQYIVDEHNKKIAVQIPIETFEQIEEVLENKYSNRTLSLSSHFPSRDFSK